MDESVIDNELLGERAVFPVVVELKSFHILRLAVCVLLEGLDDRHAPLVRLKDVHNGVSHETWLLLGDDVRLYGDGLLIGALVVLGCVVLHGQVEELLFRVFVLS